MTAMCRHGAVFSSVEEELGLSGTPFNILIGIRILGLPRLARTT